MKTKVCGITSAADALTASQLGADALGFIFATGSPRYIAPESVRDIVRQLSPFVTPVGVFVNAPREDILRVCQLSGVRALQLHGDELPADLAGYDIPVYKAHRVKPGFNPASISEYRRGTFLLDTSGENGHGGTGITFDWDVAVAAKRYGNVILAGGLSPANVVAAVQRVRPYAIDVNSGVESSPGRKDAMKLRELFSLIRNL